MEIDKVFKNKMINLFLKNWHTLRLVTTKTVTQRISAEAHDPT